MSFEHVFASEDLILSEGSMYERMRRHAGLPWDDHVAHAGLIYEDRAASILAATHREYIEVARSHGVPMLVGSATWRANQERHSRSKLRDRPINEDNIEFVRSLCQQEATADAPLFVSAGLGPRGDAYKPEEALGEEPATRFHSRQAEAFARACPDVVMGMTLPAASEARGIARALEATGLPYVLSFVVRDTGALLDGTPLTEAIDSIDQARARPPLGYSINCVHPAVLLRGLDHESELLRRRIIGFRGNTADKTPEQLLAADELISEDPTRFASTVSTLRDALQLKIVGGCCGTGTEHIAAIADTLGADR